MGVVIILWHLCFFAQYASCLLLWTNQDSAGVNYINIALDVFSALAATLSSFLCGRGPLGRGSHNYQGSQEVVDLEAAEVAKRFKLVLRDGSLITEKPEWQGELFGFMDDVRGACLSLFCPCCVFGWNMGRFYLGNMYWQVVTIFLFCLAPLFVFNLSAMHTHNHAVKLIFFVSSVVFCFLGLFYCAVWRIMMQKWYDLQPEGTLGGDVLQWLFCCWCSLAQELRTVDFYKVVRIDGNVPRGMARIGDSHGFDGYEHVDNEMKPPTIEEMR